MGQSEATIPILKLADAFNTGILLQLAGIQRSNECSTCKVYLTRSCQRCSLCGSPKNAPCRHCDFEFGRSDDTAARKALSMKGHQGTKIGG